MIAALGCTACRKRFRVKTHADGSLHAGGYPCPYCRVVYETDPVPIPRFLVLVDGEPRAEYQSEAAAIIDGEEQVRAADHAPAGHRYMVRSVEVVRSVRRWERDADTGELLEVGEKVEQPA